MKALFLKKISLKNVALMAAFLSFSAVFSASAQQFSDEIFTFKTSFTSGYNWNSHAADFAQLPGVDNCCPIFETGSGTGFYTGFSFEMQHYTGFTFGVRANFSAQNAVLKGRQDIDVIVGDTAVRPGTFENSIAADYATLGLEPVVMYNPVSRFHILAGARFGLAIITEYSQKETIVEPQSGVFKENGRRVRNERSGVIPDANIFQAAFLIGATQEFSLNKKQTMFLAPEIILQIAMSDIIANTEWKANALRAGISFKFIL